jgi:hypothetical protein
MAPRLRWVKWVKISLPSQQGPRHIAAIVLLSADGVMQFWGYLRNEIW